MRRCGYTLIEVVVASGIGALLMTAVLFSFVATGKLMSWAGVHQDVGSSALMSLNTLSREVRASSWQTLTIANGVLAFQMQDADSPNLLGFTPAQAYVLYYVDGQQNWTRKVWTGAQPSLTSNPIGTMQRLAASDMTSLIAQTNGSERILARGVQSIAWSPMVYPDTVPWDTVTVTVLMMQTANSTQNVQTTVTTTLAPRNHP